MLIGVTLEGDSGLDGLVSTHFGQCSHFLLAEIEAGKLKSSRVARNKAQHGGGACLAVDEILSHGVTHVIAGGMGMGAQQKFAAAGVPVFGFSGKASDAIDHLLRNNLGGLGTCAGHAGCH